MLQNLFLVIFVFEISTTDQMFTQRKTRFESTDSFYLTMGSTEECNINTFIMELLILFNALSKQNTDTIIWILITHSFQTMNAITQKY